MKCHYEILELERDASQEDIKKARDRLAKKYHPDKAYQSNDPASVQEFTEKFRLIQQAYEVLSDPHEKAWYDSHREQILSSGNKVKEEIDVFQYFNSSCYSGYGDDPEGFYAVYSHVFKKISEADIRIAESDKEEYSPPDFGNSGSSYEDVVSSFYGFWQGYSTKRKFYEHDKWDLRTADNRRIARAMEKENKKARDTAKKEWNDSVRELATFIRKRDPRVKAYRKLLEAKAQEAQEKVKQLQEQQRLQRQELLKAGKADYDAMEMEKHYRQLEKTLGHESSEAEESENEEVEVIEDETDDPLYCIACDKQFRSFPAMRNHTNSKQHKKNIAILRSELEENEDSAALLAKLEKLDMSPSTEDAEDEIAVGGEPLEDSPVLQSRSKAKKSRRGKDFEVEGRNSVGGTDRPLEEAPATQPANSKAKRKSQKQKAVDVEETEADEETVILAEAPAEIVVEEYQSRNKTKRKAADKKADQKVKELGLRCGVCKELFSTRNKLFQHIKSEGHGVAK